MSPDFVSIDSHPPMTTCILSHSSTLLPIDPATCGADCEGVEFTVDSVTSGGQSGGKHTVKYKVTRKTTDSSGNTTSTEFSGEESLSSPGSGSVTFYCDATKNCPRFKLTLTCSAPANPPGNV